MKYQNFFSEPNQKSQYVFLLRKRNLAMDPHSPIRDTVILSKTSSSMLIYNPVPFILFNIFLLHLIYFVCMCSPRSTCDGEKTWCSPSPM